MLAFGALGPVATQAAAAATLYVSQGGLDSGTCTSASPCATVSYALTKAASGATIEVSGTIDDHLAIKSPVTITTWPGKLAPPAALDGTASGSVVTVDPGVTGVTLNDLTIENGALGVYNSEGTLRLTDSTVSGNATVAEPSRNLELRRQHHDHHRQHDHEELRAPRASAPALTTTGP